MQAGSQPVLMLGMEAGTFTAAAAGEVLATITGVSSNKRFPTLIALLTATPERAPGRGSGNTLLLTVCAHKQPGSL